MDKNPVTPLLPNLDDNKNPLLSQEDTPTRAVPHTSWMNNTCRLYQGKHPTRNELLPGVGSGQVLFAVFALAMVGYYVATAKLFSQ